MYKKNARFLVPVALLIAALIGSFYLGKSSNSTSGGGMPAERPAVETATVISITDGDTIKVRLSDGREEKVRYIGINTPEMDQPLGEEAKIVNRDLVAGKQVRMVRDISERDRYGRLLRYVYSGDLFVNAELVRLGYAQASTYPPDVEYSDYFLSTQREAQSAGAGLWASPAVR